MIVGLDYSIVLKNLLFEAGELNGEFLAQKLVVKCVLHKAAHCSTQSLVQACRVYLAYSCTEHSCGISPLQLFVGTLVMVTSSSIACGEELVPKTVKSQE